MNKIQGQNKKPSTFPSPTPKRANNTHPKKARASGPKYRRSSSHTWLRPLAPSRSTLAAGSHCPAEPKATLLLMRHGNVASRLQTIGFALFALSTIACVPQVGAKNNEFRAIPAGTILWIISDRRACEDLRKTEHFHSVSWP